MTTYHLSVHKPCSSYADLDTFSTREIPLDNEADYYAAEQLCENKKNMAPAWKQLVVPIRTDQASDLFFPTLMNLVIKTKFLAESCFAIIGAIFLDLATLPLRLITFLPRLVYNASVRREEHPLIPYLRAKGLRPEELEGVSPVVGAVDARGLFNLHQEEKDGRVNVRLYRRRRLEDGRIEDAGERYRLYLTDREIGFPIFGKYAHFMSTRPA
jgi:hypothetical protein